MSANQLSEYTRFAKYARAVEGENRRESWKEMVARVQDMHEQQLANLGAYNDVIDDLEWASSMLSKKFFLGSQRALQFGGDAILNNNARLYNCCASYCDRPKFFSETLWLLLCGCGVGFSVQKHHVDRLPEIEKRTKGTQRFVVPDSIEGWSDAVGVLLASFWKTDRTEWSKAYHGYEVEFDFSQIRPAGSPISWGGIAPGPDALNASLKKVEDLLNKSIENGITKLRPIDAYDIVMHLSDAVLSGGVRRSATICLFSPDDDEMATAKTGNWFYENPQRGRSNNSALLVRSETTKDQFKSLMKNVQECGEPGFIWSDSTEVLFNPCQEISFYAYLQEEYADDWKQAKKDAWFVDPENGISGWSFCNLCEINGKKCNTKERFFDTCRAASIYGTIQASYTNFSYLGKTTKQIVSREALLGVSMTGMMDSPDILFDPAIQKRGAQIVKETNASVAARMGISPAARTTCVKPAGTTSCILETASGVHPHHSTRYIRRVQANVHEFPLQIMSQHNPAAVEDSVWATHKTDKVISFLCEVPPGAKTKNQLSAIDLLEHVKLTQQNWVESGVRKSQCVQPYLRHNVSNTITVKPDEWEDVTNFIFKNRKWYAGISLLPFSGDKDYPQAPFTAIHTPREMVSEYGDGAMFASGLIVAGLEVFNGNLWEACDYALDIKKDDAKDNVAMDDWKRRVVKFAENYTDGDIRRCTYLLKDVHGWKQWCDLKRVYTEIDWENLQEMNAKNEVDVSTIAAAACAGGKCDII